MIPSRKVYCNAWVLLRPRTIRRATTTSATMCTLWSLTMKHISSQTSQLWRFRTQLFTAPVSAVFSRVYFA